MIAPFRVRCSDCQQKHGQLVLPGSPPRTHRRDDHDTSIEAGRTTDLGRGQALVLEAHAEHPEGLTDFELYELLPDEWPATIGRRRGDLVEMGLIEPTLLTRVSPRGRDATVWRIVDGAR